MLKAVILNCSLKKSDETSNTRALIGEAVKIFDKNNVETEVIRLADYSIPLGISENVGPKDEWPYIFNKIKEANIVIIGTPLWLGEKSSLATLAMERLLGGSRVTNEKGQQIYYNKVGGVIVTGNEDGAKDASKSILYGLSHLGFTVPPNADAYWVGEAGPGSSFIEAEGMNNEFTSQHIEMMSHNLIHFGSMLEEHPIPAEGNVME
ncbi:flavodoxin family protein [Bacillus sp. AK128]